MAELQYQTGFANEFATESVPGVQGNCNGDQFAGDIAALRMLGVPGDVGPSQTQEAEASPSGTPAPAQATPAVREQLDKLSHVAVLLDSISARDLAGVVRTAVAAIKREYNIP